MYCISYKFFTAQIYFTIFCETKEYKDVTKKGGGELYCTMYIQNDSDAKFRYSRFSLMKYCMLVLCYTIYRCCDYKLISKSWKGNTIPVS